MYYFFALLVFCFSSSRPCVSKMERNVSPDLVTGQNPTRLSPAKFKTGVTVRGISISTYDAFLSYDSGLLRVIYNLAVKA